MKTPLIIGISAGIAVVAVLGVWFGIISYQQAQEMEELERETEALENLLGEMALEQEKSRIIQEEMMERMHEEMPGIMQQEMSQSFECSGSARCYTGTVSDVIDGDTIRVGAQLIRFSLASTPELHEFGGMDAKNFVEGICPVGSNVLIDEDDGQTEGSYGRILAVVYCNGMNLNEAVISHGHGMLSSGFCGTSEFSSHPWAQRHGCGTMMPQMTTKIPDVTTQLEACDSSYPDVCIPPSPPDLDCGEISYKNFRVLPPDPHRFDGDKDGIGCES